MGLNGDLILARFEDIHRSLERLERIKAMPREQFLADQDLLDLASYCEPAWAVAVWGAIAADLRSPWRAAG